MNTIPQPRSGFADADLKAPRLDTGLVKRLVAEDFEDMRTDSIPSRIAAAARYSTEQAAFYRASLALLPEIQPIFERSLERVMYGAQVHAVPPVIEVVKHAELAWLRLIQQELPVVTRELKALQDRLVAEGKLTGSAADSEHGIAHTFIRHYQYFGGRGVFRQAVEALIPPRGAAVAAG